MLATLAVIEAEQLADRTTVVRRDGTVLYDNELVDSAWHRRAAADRAGAAMLLPLLLPSLRRIELNAAKAD
ncbi:hypothetical protein AB0D12_34055 [Streptomyces sp. NPDC048479]|uniref:hypothetical protein n=1 Tax=Streptomyces sp. NPDC048479 TaxID=3154725 RepID=UPI003441180C